MRSISAAELKEHLAEYLSSAKGGESIVIRESNVAVAKLIPFAEINTRTEFSEETLKLAAAGIMLLPEEPLDIEDFVKMPRAQVEGNALTQALLDERDEGR